MDMALTELASGVPVDVMPGASDPASAALPQQPLHRCLFPAAAAYRCVSIARYAPLPPHPISQVQLPELVGLHCCHFPQLRPDGVRLDSPLPHVIVTSACLSKSASPQRECAVLPMWQRRFGIIHVFDQAPASAYH